MSPGAKTSITPAAVINQPKQPTVAKTPCDRQFAVSATEFDVDPTKKPLCIWDFYGNNCNRMITLAKALYLASEMSTMVQLDDAWSKWFVQFFDPHPRISLSHMFVVSNGTATLNPEHNPNALQTTQCIKRVQADEVYRTMEPVSVAVHRGVRVPMLDQLVPKRSIREEAERQVQKRYANGKQAVSVSDEGNAMETQPAMTSTDVQNSMEPSQNPLQYPFVSVHRRWLGGGCLDAANKPHRHFDNCTVSSLVATCEYTHNAVLQTLNRQSSSLSSKGPTVDESSPLIVLFTDGQKAVYDSTFPIRDPNEFALQLWMMTLSQQHFGSPQSTVDVVVRHWRHHRIQQHENAKPGSNPPRNDIVHPIECNPSWV
uniref:Uncharacterized protein n=1 Tax=Craspedostauros australis TaxID=1486917 RepID=A0A7R9ZKY0_9STRA